MKNVISFSLWGNEPMYWFGAKENIKLAVNYFRGWKCRFYVDKNCNKELIESLIAPNSEIILVEKINDYDGMFWRFLASVDPEVNICLSRDCDSRFSDREIAAIIEWLSSDKDFHIMRDHPNHQFPILGGMWGSRNGIMKEIGLKHLIKQWGRYDRKGIDQDFLGQVVYPLVQGNCFEHSEFNISYGAQIHSFPTKRNDYEFVGDVFDERNLRHHEYWKFIKDYKE